MELNSHGFMSAQGNGAPTAKELRSLADAILPDVLVLPKEEAIAHTAARLRAPFAQKLKKLRATSVLHLRAASERRTEATRRHNELVSTTPPTVTTPFVLGGSRWEKFAFFLLLAVSAITLCSEALNLAYFHRHVTDSIPWALAYSTCIFVLALGEAIVFQKLSLPARKWLAIGQFILAAASAGAFLYYSLTVADTTWTTIFAEGQSPDLISLDSRRMFFQVATSLLLSGLCICGAISMGSSGTAENPDYRSEQDAIARLHASADACEQEQAAADGQIDEIESLIEADLQYVAGKHAQKRAEDVRHASAIRDILP